MSEKTPKTQKQVSGGSEPGRSERLGDLAADVSSSRRKYWQAQDQALTKARTGNRKWSAKRRAVQAKPGNEIWKRVTYSLPREQAQAKAREFLRKYPKAAYWSEVESWRELPGDVIEFTMRRLPTAD